MLTKEENELLTRVGPGTPAGEMLRRYWWPVGFSEEVTPQAGPVRVRLLGEDLVLFRPDASGRPDLSGRDGQGQVGLLGLHCSHRGTALGYGRVEAAGLRCPYHGWLYDRDGRCLDQPAEPDASTFKERIRHPAYPVQELSGLIFAYLGPGPAPLLPKYDLMMWGEGTRVLSSQVVHCNWLQTAENVVDQSHTPFLHAGPHPDLAFKRATVRWERTSFGIRSHREVPGIRTGSITYLIFPSHLRHASNRFGGRGHTLRFHVPTDDTTNTTFAVRIDVDDEGRGGPYTLETRGLQPNAPGVYERVDDGYWGIASNDQDRMAQESEGPIYDRSQEHLGTSDRGVLLLREMVKEAIEAVGRGEDPIGVLRDPERNVPIGFDSAREGVPAIV